MTEEDKISCMHFLRGHVDQLICQPGPSIMIACQAVPKMMGLLMACPVPNIDPNIKFNNNGNVDWGLVPKMNWFSEKLRKGYTFLQSFKGVSNNLPNKVNTFSVLLEGKASI